MDSNWPLNGHSDMAGDWIKVEKSTCYKPEILRIAGDLGVHPDHAFGLCIRFWSWCDDQLENGDIACVTEDMLDALFGRTGFAKSLIKVDWLRVRSGSLEVPNFDRHLSESAKKRSVSRESSKKHRSSKRDTNGDKNVTTRGHQRREEKRRESNKKSKQKKTPNPEEVTFPEELKSTRFPDVWLNWIKYKRERKESIASTTQEQAFAKAVRVGGNVVAAALEESMANGHQGWTYHLDKHIRSQNGGRDSPKKGYLPAFDFNESKTVHVPD